MARTVVIEIAGKVTIGHDVALRENVHKALEAGAENVIMSMARVTRMDSSGIGELVAAHTAVTARGGRFLLVGLSDRLATILQITNLLGVLELFEDMDAALAALGEGAAE